MELLATLEQLPPVSLLKRSFLVYPLVNAAHVLSIGMLLTTVVLMDLRILGALAALDRPVFIRIMRRFALAAFLGALLTGLPMFAIRATEYTFNPAFRLKMLLLLLAGANVLAMRLFASEGDQPRNTARARLIAGFSLLIWPSILLCGRFIGFV